MSWSPTARIGGFATRAISVDWSASWAGRWCSAASPAWSWCCPFSGYSSHACTPRSDCWRRSSAPPTTRTGGAPGGCCPGSTESARRTPAAARRSSGARPAAARGPGRRRDRDGRASAAPGTRARSGRATRRARCRGRRTDPSASRRARSAPSPSERAGSAPRASPAGRAARGGRGGSPGALPRLGALEEAEELALRRQDQRGAAAERGAIRVQRALEGIEVRVAAVRLGEDVRSLRVARAAHHLPRLLRVGEDDLHVLVRLGADFARLLVTLGTELLRLTLALAAHAAEHRLLVLLRKVRTLDADVDHLDPVDLGLLGAARGDVRHQRLALVAHDLAQRVAPERLAEIRVDDVVEARLCAALVAHRAIELERVGDAEARVVVDHELLLVDGEDLLGRGVVVEEPAVEVDHLLDEGDLPVQAGLAHHAHRLAELHHQGLGPRRHREDRQVPDRDHQGQRPEHPEPAAVHVSVLRRRPEPPASAARRAGATRGAGTAPSACRRDRPSRSSAPTAGCSPWSPGRAVGATCPSSWRTPPAAR